MCEVEDLGGKRRQLIEDIALAPFKRACWQNWYSKSYILSIHSAFEAAQTKGVTRRVISVHVREVDRPDHDDH